MPRQARKKSSSGIYHIILRGVNKEAIFHDREDKEKFLATLKFYKNVSEYELFAYYLMDNHVHLLIKEVSDPLQIIIKRFSSSYVIWFNKKYMRCGHLFQERYRSEAVENDRYFLSVLRYIHQNPVKAGITKRVGDYQWSSFSEFIGKPTFVNVDFVFAFFADERFLAINFFSKFINEINDDKCLEVKNQFTDSELVKYIITMGLDEVGELQSYSKEQRNAFIKTLKSLDGVTIRQVERVTGITRSVISRA